MEVENGNGNLKMQGPTLQLDYPIAFPTMRGKRESLWEENMHRKKEGAVAFQKATKRKRETRPSFDVTLCL